MNPALQSAFIRRPAPLMPFVLGSIAAHTLFFGAILLFSYFKLTPAVDLDQKPIHAELVRLGKPRDQKLLPRKDELPPPPQEVKSNQSAPDVPPPEQKTVPVPGMKPDPSKSQQGARDAEKKKLFGAFDKLGKAKQPDEVEGEANGDPDGKAAKAEGDQYVALITTQVRREYNVADTISDQERMYLKAQVFLRIGHTGEVSDVKLVKPSGNDLFDSAVLAAVKKARLSPPPVDVQDEFQSKGVVLEFKP